MVPLKHGDGEKTRTTRRPAARESSALGSGGTLTYEDRLDRDPRWALSEGSRHFEEHSAVFQALHKIAERLTALRIPYAVVGGIALFRHGLRRFTEDVDILVTPANLRVIHEQLEGLGYLPPFRNSKHLRDTELGVKIEFLTTGDFPGDGQPKPVAFPDPRDVSFEAEGISYLTLEKLAELKLASGMTNAGWLKDLSDVLELIKTLDLPRDYASRLDPFVQRKFDELWTAAADELDRMRRDEMILEDVRPVMTDAWIFRESDQEPRDRGVAGPVDRPSEVPGESEDPES